VKTIRPYVLLLCLLLFCSAGTLSLPAAADRNLYRFDSGLKLGGPELFVPWWNAGAVWSVYRQTRKLFKVS